MIWRGQTQRILLVAAALGWGVCTANSTAAQEAGQPPPASPAAPLEELPAEVPAEIPEEIPEGAAAAEPLAPLPLTPLGEPPPSEVSVPQASSPPAEALPPLTAPLRAVPQQTFPPGDRTDAAAAAPLEAPPPAPRADGLPAPPLSGGRPRSADGTLSVIVPPAAAGLPVGPPPGTLPQGITPGLPATPQALDGEFPVRGGSSQPPPDSALAILVQALELPARSPGSAAPAGLAEDRASSRPLPLLEALERSGDRARRLWITQAYWKLTAAVVQARAAADAHERLSLVAPGSDPHDQSVLDMALETAAADLDDARASLTGVQQELVDLVRLPINEPLPWPADRPLTTTYQTHFNAIFAARPATGRVRAINRQLPHRHAALQHRAAAVLAGEQAFAMAEADHAKGQRPIEAVLVAHDALVAQQRSFAEAMRAYNCDIAEYAMSVADLSVPDDRYAAMLIGNPLPWRPQTIPQGQPVIPAGGLQPPPPVAFPAATLEPRGTVVPVLTPPPAQTGFR